MRRFRQAKCRGCVLEQVERVESAQDRLVTAVQPRLGVPGLFELLQARVGALLQLGDGPELNAGSRAGLRARRRQPGLQAVITEGALARHALLIHRNDSERAAGHAVAAAVAYVLLDVD